MGEDVIGSALNEVGRLIDTLDRIIRLASVEMRAAKDERERLFRLANGELPLPLIFTE